MNSDFASILDTIPIIVSYVKRSKDYCNLMIVSKIFHVEDIRQKDKRMFIHRMSMGLIECKECKDSNFCKYHDIMFNVNKLEIKDLKYIVEFNNGQLKNNNNAIELYKLLRRQYLNKFIAFEDKNYCNIVIRKWYEFESYYLPEFRQNDVNNIKIFINELEKLYN